MTYIPASSALSCARVIKVYCESQGSTCENCIFHTYDPDIPCRFIHGLCGPSDWDLSNFDSQTNVNKENEYFG